MIKKHIATLLLFTSIVSSVYGKEYVGKKEAISISETIQFDDVDPNYWASEPIARAGALSIIKGFSNYYRPYENVRHDEAIIMITRGLGLENTVLENAEEIREAYSEDVVEEVWSLGYMVLAEEMEVITGEELSGLLDKEQENAAFKRDDFATREQVFVWLVDYIDKVQKGLLEDPNGYNKIFEYDDWKEIEESNYRKIEKALINNVVAGFDNKIDPKGLITRSEMAQLMKNITERYPSLLSIETIRGGIYNIETIITKDEVKKIVTVVNEKGEYDTLVYIKEKPTVEYDFVVYKDGQAKNMDALEKGDEIDYIIQGDNILYVNSKGITEHKQVGKLLEFKDLDPSKISIRDEDGEVFEYYLADYLHRNGTEIKFGDEFITLDKLPISKNIEITVKGMAIINIEKAKDDVLYEQIRGVVLDNSPDFGYITIMGFDGIEITTKYEKNKITVEKQKYTDIEDEIGYIDEMFPGFEYDERDATIDEVENGDVVYMQIVGGKVSKVSAKTNYKAKYVLVKSISESADGIKILAENEDGSYMNIEIESDTFTTKNNRIFNSRNIELGDYLKLLVNEVVLEPGNVYREVKEVVVDTNNKLIKNLYRGDLAFINALQGEIIIKDVESLSKIGWGEYNNSISFNFEDEEIKYYSNGKRISKDYVEKYFKNYDGVVYIATEQFYDDEKIKKITFRNEREYDLETDNVIYTDGLGNIKLGYKEELINTDEGTIVRRYGRLVDNVNILDTDYAKIVMNGSRAAIIDIFGEASIKNIGIYRGRLKSIEKNRKFTLDSFSSLDGMFWDYSTVDKQFEFDRNTVIYDADAKIVDKDKFIDYTEDSKVKKIYTIAAIGNKAIVLSEGTFTKEGVKGEVYEISGSTIGIKDSYVYVPSIKKWEEVSIKNPTINMEIAKNAIYVKNNKVVDMSEIQKGDKIRIMTDVNYKTKASSDTIKGYIILVEG